MTLSNDPRDGPPVSSSGGAQRAPACPARYRNALVVLLTLSAGALDAVSYLRLGKVFSSVVTGNLALLGVASSTRDGTLALNAGWPWHLAARVTVTLAVEWALLVAFSIGWLGVGEHPAGSGGLGLLVLGVAAMGVQSTAVRRLGPMSTAYLTSTLTGILTGLAVRRWPAEWQRSTGVILAAVAGAALGGLAARCSPGWVPAAISHPITTVLAYSARLAETGLPIVPRLARKAPVAVRA